MSGHGRMLCPFCKTINQLKTTDQLTDRIVVLDEFTKHSCPSCHQQLKLAIVDETKVEACINCHGFVINREDFAKVVWTRRASFTGAETIPAPVVQEELKLKRKCPGCAMDMECYPYYGPGNAVIDGCHQCEIVWLDAGELTAIEVSPGQRTVRTHLLSHEQVPKKHVPGKRRQEIIDELNGDDFVQSLMVFADLMFK